MHHEVDATSNLCLDAQIGMNTSQHDLSSMQVLLKLLLFLEFNLFIILHIAKFVNTFVNPARHLQLDKPIPHIVSKFLWHKVEFGS